ncbi:SDR family NAD(P)-dependent oxidoreductase [Synechococcus sp. PCC 7336]|uniref:SDR family NAD(P)-dependent oxidoreductase n=1 Tax=Synechococcus sp. PCC 7336 TaxID=195250 RepID=UPI0003494279|nr:SDR family oxidoreductase [Synechococcus sp. PCC 7336]
MKLDFSNQTVLVTGASRGIGAQIAADFSDCGAKLIVTATDESSEAKIRSRLGESTQFLAVDFSISESINHFLASIRKIDRIDACVNNAGLSRHRPLEAATEEEWDLTNSVNLKAPFLLTQAVAESMKRNLYGRIVNIASIWSQITIPDRGVYTATKFGLHGLTISSAAELSQYNILTNTVSPGFTLTDMLKGNYSKEALQAIADKIPMKRLAEPEEISKVVLFLSSQLNSYVTGQNILVDGGYSVL